MNPSIVQNGSKRDRGDRTMPRIEEALDILESFGFSLKDQRYKEQSYYKKTVAKSTSDHGQFKLDLTFEEHGASIIGSNDCQLPMMVYLGLNIDGEILPMVKALEVKNLSCYDSKVTLLNQFLPAANNKLADIVECLANRMFTKAQSLAVFTEVQGYKSSIMTCLTCIPTVQECTGFELFLSLIDTLINGHGVSTDGKKLRKIKHIRRKIQLTEKIMEVVMS